MSPNARAGIPPRIVCPYVPELLRPETVAALEVYDARFVDVSASESLYWRILSTYWYDQRAVIVVEQDVVPPTGALRRMWHCPAPWCMVPYPGPGGALLKAALGCTKFSAFFMRKYPDLLERVGKVDGDSAVPSRSWRRLDVRLTTVLAELMGVPNGQAMPHLHWPAAQHLNPSSMVAR